MDLGEYFTEEEMVNILKLKSVAALKSRRARGTNHPPYVEIGRTVLYPRRMFFQWVDGKAVIWEVRSVG